MHADIDKDTADIGNTSEVAVDKLLSLQQWLPADWNAQFGAEGGGNSISARALLMWWSRYKYVVMAHDVRIYRRIGPLLADLSGDVSARAEQVLALAIEAVSVPASRNGHINALQHVAGYVKRALDENAKSRWRQALADYEAGLTPLQVPAALLQEYLQRHGREYVREQFYPGLFLQFPAPGHPNT